MNMRSSARLELGLIMRAGRRILDVGAEQRDWVRVATVAGDAGFAIWTPAGHWGSVQVPFGARIDIGPYEEAHEPLGPYESRDEALYAVARRLSACLALAS